MNEHCTQPVSLGPVVPGMNHSHRFRWAETSAFSSEARNSAKESAGRQLSCSGQRKYSCAKAEKAATWGSRPVSCARIRPTAGAAAAARSASRNSSRLRRASTSSTVRAYSHLAAKRIIASLSPGVSSWSYPGRALRAANSSPYKEGPGGAVKCRLAQAGAGRSAHQHHVCARATLDSGQQTRGKAVFQHILGHGAVRSPFATGHRDQPAGTYQHGVFAAQRRCTARRRSRVPPAGADRPRCSSRRPAWAGAPDNVPPRPE